MEETDPRKEETAITESEKKLESAPVAPQPVKEVAPPAQEKPKEDKKEAHPPLPVDKFALKKTYVDVTQGKNPIVSVFKTTKKLFRGRPYMAYRSKDHKELGMVNLQTPMPFSHEAQAFYDRRYYLFSKFDKGIKIDEESWSSVTPEEIAKHIARRCTNVFGEKGGTIIDGFSGVGGNSIQLAKKVKKVYAVDIDDLKLHNLEHNAQIYNCQDSVQTVHKDFL